MATEYLRYKDSDGVEHYVDRQNEAMSCALASLGMAWQATRRQCLANAAEERLKLTSSAFPGSLLKSQLLGENNGLGDGTSSTNMTQTLTKIGVVVTQLDNFYPQGKQTFFWRKERINMSHPAIILVGWYAMKGSKLKRNGGHFIVADRVTSKGWVVVLDPAKGTMHELHGSHGYYLNHGLTGRIDMIWYSG